MKPWFKLISSILVVVIPLAIAWLTFVQIAYWLFGVDRLWGNTFVHADHPPRAGYGWFGLLVQAPGYLVAFYGLYRLEKLFLRFRRGAVMDAASARHLRAYSLSVMAATVLGFLTSGARRWAAGEFDNYPLWTHLQIVDADFILVFTSFIFFMFSHVLVEAEKYKSESEQYL